MKRLAAILFLLASPLLATDYYVSTSGSGSAYSFSNPGNLSAALADNSSPNFQPGDNLWIRGGTYTPSASLPFVWNKHASGTAAQPITVRNYNNEEVIIDCNADLSTTADGPTCFGVHGFATSPYGEYIRIWGLKFINSSTGTRFNEHGSVTVTNGSPVLTRSVGPAFQVNPTATVHATNGSATVTWVSGTQFPVGSWVNKRIVINSVIYQVLSVQTTSSLTLTTTFVGATNDYASTVLPGNWSNLTFTLDSQGTPETLTVSHCLTTSSCTMTSNVTHASATYVSHWPTYGEFSVANLNQIVVANTGSALINNMIFDNGGGTDMSGQYGGNLLIYGNIKQYAGQIGTVRSYGHGGYYQNLMSGGEAGRSIAKDNIIVRPFDLCTQTYSTTTDVAFISLIGNVYMGCGHAKYPTEAWPATGQTVSGPNLYLGTSGSISNGCYPPDGTGSSTKVLQRVIVDRNWTYGPTQAAIQLGGSKGSCNATITNNRFINGLQGPWLANGTFGAVTLTGNTFMFGTDTTGAVDRGGPSPIWTAANYPTNTYLAAVPSSGPDVIAYRPNEYETGRGHIFVDNPDSSATASINLVCTNCPSPDANGAGVYVGEAYKVFNAQDADLFQSTPVATGTCAVSPCTISVPMACTGSCVVRQPGFTGLDLTTPIAKPADLGPRVAAFIVIPNWGTATTPTPTNTATNTNTPTNTATRTPTATLTPLPATATPTLTPIPATNTPTFTPTATPTVTPPPVPSLSFSVSDTHCVATLPMVTAADASGAFGGYSASSVTANSGLLTCTFSVPTDGEYRFWVNVNATNAQTDSVFVDMDGDGGSTCVLDGDTTCQQIFDIAERKLCLVDPLDPHACEYSATRGSWFWNPINLRNSSCGGCVGIYSEKRWTLTAGTHVLKFRGREAAVTGSAKIAYVIATTDLGFDPNQSPFPPTAVPTNTPTGTPTIVFTNTPTATNTPTDTPTETPTGTRTPTQTFTQTFTPSNTPTRSPTPTVTPQGYCRRKIQCNGKARILLVPCHIYRLNPCPW